MLVFFCCYEIRPEDPLIKKINSRTAIPSASARFRLDEEKPIGLGSCCQPHYPHYRQLLSTNRIIRLCYAMTFSSHALQGLISIAKGIMSLWSISLIYSSVTL
jgi:hypothetical protein